MNAVLKAFSVIEYPDYHYLRAAQGWIELGLPQEAQVEIEHISDIYATHPDVINARWHLCAAEARWEEALSISGKLMHLAPEFPASWIHRAFSLHELNRTQEAREILVPAAYKFPHISIIPYNLACYSCRLGQLHEAKRWLQKAMIVGDRTVIRKMAMQDTDLKPLWKSLKR